MKEKKVMTTSSSVDGDVDVDASLTTSRSGH